MEKFVIVATEQDLASKNIGNKLVEFGFEKINDNPFPTYKKDNALLIWHPKDLIWVDNLDNYFNPECYIFVFRHISPKEQSILTVHSTGNLTSDVKRAGKPFELAYSHPIYKRALLKGLKKYAPEGYEVSYEATHHSPTTLKKPVIFVEIGGGEKQWKDNNAIDAAAKAVLDLLDYEKEENLKICIGLGGSHNADRFTRRALEENIAFGHIIPAYAFSCVN